MTSKFSQQMSMIHVKPIIKKINYLETIGIYKLNQGDHFKKNSKKHHELL